MINLAGSFTPNGRVSERTRLFLIDRDLAWHADVEHMPAFAPTVAEIKAMFATL
jgi:hypothetical protein